MKVLPTPEIFSMKPCLISANDVVSSSVEITVSGKYFGSYLARGYYKDTYDYIDVIIGNTSCNITLFVSDEQLICKGLPEKYGLFTVHVQVRF